MSEREAARGLSYYLPEPKRPHTVLHIPSSHTLYIGPSACTRRHAIHAIEYGDRGHASFLYITQADVISGDYEKVVGDAIEQLLQALVPQPSIFLLAVFCIDDFLGTDEKALLSLLSARFPQKKFALEHIDPVTLDERAKDGQMKGKTNLYAFLTPTTVRDNGVNFLGTFVPLPEDCEFLELLQQCGVSETRALFACKTYAQYQQMAQSRLAIGLRFVPDSTVQLMTQTLGIPYYDFPTSYDAQFVAKGYREIARLLGSRAPDLAPQIAAAEQDARQTAKQLQGLRLAIDASACMMVFSAARALLQYGFQVAYVFESRHFSAFDLQAKQALLSAHPEVTVCRLDDYENLLGKLEAEDCIAIGADCHRILRTRSLVDLWHDEGYFGFQGIHKLMAGLRAAREVWQSGKA